MISNHSTAQTLPYNGTFEGTWSGISGYMLPQNWARPTYNGFSDSVGGYNSPKAIRFADVYDGQFWVDGYIVQSDTLPIKPTYFSGWCKGMGFREVAVYDSFGNLVCGISAQANFNFADWTYFIDTMHYTSGATPYVTVISIGSSGIGGTTAYFDSLHLDYIYNPTSVPEVKNDHQITLSPNPSNDHFTINTNENIKGAMLEVFNIMGARVFSVPLNGNEQKIDCSSLQQGIYFVKITEGTNSFVQKLYKE